VWLSARANHWGFLGDHRSRVTKARWSPARHSPPRELDDGTCTRASRRAQAAHRPTRPPYHSCLSCAECAWCKKLTNANRTADMDVGGLPEGGKDPIARFEALLDARLSRKPVSKPK